MVYILPRGVNLLPFDSNRFQASSLFRLTGIGLLLFDNDRWFVVHYAFLIFFPMLGRED